MESKKLQQLQQANSHLAPQPMPQKRPPPPFHPTKGDYRSPRLSGLQNQLQYLSLSSNCSQVNLMDQNSTSCQQPPKGVSSPSHMQSKPNTQNAYKKQSSTSHYLDEQLFQNISPERIYQMAPTRSHYNSLAHSHSHPVQSLQQQYQQLQQAKIKQQIQTQNEALVQQQRTFALRQQLNPPIPQSHFHMQSPIVLPTIVQSQLQQPSLHQSTHKNVPPSTLNLSSQFQPAPGPMKTTNMEMKNQHYNKDVHNEHFVQAQKTQNQLIYLHNKQMQQIVKSKLETVTPGEQGPVYIQQNHPGHVVNQACQTQISGAIGSKMATPTESSKSPSHLSTDRKKTAITMQTLKSPVTKGPIPSSVKISGWLYKQGSDGLKVWRKRWFVLSEYCLYYYKSPEEEKLLGSILLPSYRVAACAVEDKIYRKYAFKCEHTNMRTYWLAAENSETMGQWIRALTAATMMQASSESSDQISQPSVSSLNHSCENSDSGIHTFQSQQSKTSISQGPVTPVSDSGGGVQPLYANAPPKPRRVNDGGYSSPSPENSLERCDTSTESRYQTSAHYTQRNDIKSHGIQLQNQQPALQQAIYDTRTGNVTSALKVTQLPQNIENLSSQFLQFDNNKSRYQRNDYAQSPLLQPRIVVDNQRASELEQHIIRAPQRFNDELYGERDLYIQQTTNQRRPIQLNYAVGYPNAERRTPDAYGRSKSGQSRPFSDYEDIYNLTQNQNILQNQRDLSGYRRPLSPPSYNASKHVPSMPSRYATNQLENGTQQDMLLQNRSLQSSGIARPHSADFLEYEARADFADSLKADSIQSARPKSSLDINRNPDSYYYSEASYAEKMRQSALYLQKPQNSSQHFFVSPHCAKESTLLLTGSSTLVHDNQYEPRKQIEIMSKNVNEGVFSVPRTHRSNVEDYVTHQNEQFLRSASARLPRKDEDCTIKDGERKREESMKRLLEWKQRMLQSPLTRKGVQQGTTSISKLAGKTKNTSHGIQKSCSDTHANAGYNSYSSDDEDGPEFSPAGRSSPTPSSSNVIETRTKNVSQSPCSRLKIPSNTNISNLSTSLLGNGVYVPVYTQKTLDEKVVQRSKTGHPVVICESHIEQTQESESVKKNSDNGTLLASKFDTIINETRTYKDQAIVAVNETNIECLNNVVNNNKKYDGDDEDDEATNEYTDDDLDEALKLEIETTPVNDQFCTIEVNDIHQENDKYCEKDRNDSNNVPTTECTENHYLPMTSKKSILSPTHNSSVDSLSGNEENPYVEMTKCIEDIKLNDEVVCIDARIKPDTEPVYMELSHAQIKNENENKNLLDDIIYNSKSSIKKGAIKRLDSNKRKQRKTLDRTSKRNDLPDILKPPQNSLMSSDSSDADDESSKHVDGIKMRSRSRFSLSDTFRPASYYLGTSTPLVNFAESSDSEIVSPPPIPLSPPPLEELNTEELFSSENYDTIKRRDKLNLSFDQIPKIHSSNSSLSQRYMKTEGLKSSRLSLPDQFSKLRTFKTQSLKADEKTLSDSNFSFHTESSNTSSDFYFYDKLMKNSSAFVGTMYQSNSSLPQKFQTTDSETDSVELRHRLGSDSELERNRSRRPLSEELVSEIESMSEHFENILATTDLDSYLSKLQTSDIYLFHTSPNNWINDNITNFIKPPEVFRNVGDEHYYGNINFASSSDSLQQIGKDISSELKLKSRETDLSKKFLQLKEKNLSLHDAQCESDDFNNVNNSIISAEMAKSATLSSVDMDQTSFCTAYDLAHTTPVHSRNNSNTSDHSAPYYYSDIAARSTPIQDIVLTQTLNNQRDVNRKRTGIFHINNQINKNDETLEKVNTSDISSVETSKSDKLKMIDNKNLFKIKCPIEKNLSKNLELKNVNHHETSDVDGGCTSNVLTKPLIIKKTNCSPLSPQKISNAELQLEHSTNYFNNSSTLSDLSAGERLWDEDILWRESLRRVSHRHARSLDDLDRIITGSMTSLNNVIEADELCKTDQILESKQKQTKLSREVTYVNDKVSLGTRSSYHSRRSEPLKWNKNEDKNDNDVYVQLAAADIESDAYETLRKESSCGVLKKSMEVDREVIRQWDSMSSGLMKSTGGTLKITKICDKGTFEAMHNDNKHFTSTSTDTISERNSGNTLNLKNIYRAT